MKHTYALISAYGKEWWTIVLTPEDREGLMLLHKAFQAKFKLDANEDPHTIAAIDKGSWFMHPDILSAQWFAGALRMILSGLTIYINNRGGYCDLDKNMQVVKTIEAETWPATSDRPRIRISKWGQGEHYYLSSAGMYKDFVDPNIKYNSFIEAKDAALKYTTEDRIVFEENKHYFYKREGD